MAVSKRAKQIATTNKDILSLYTEQTKIKNELATIEANIATDEVIRRTSTNPVQVDAALKRILANGESKKKLKNKLKTVSSRLLAAQQELSKLVGNPVLAPGARKLEELPPLPPLTSASGTDSKGPALKWLYNPPMVKAAYLKPTGLQQQDGRLPVDNPGTWPDARRAWATSVGSKGVIQMSRSYPYYNLTQKQKVGGQDVDVAVRVVKNETVYGFKFLYNPTTVNISWGVGSEIDIAKFQAGAFRAAPITDAAMNSSVTFSIVLNRMLDMNVIDSNGRVTGDPYPVQVSAADAKEIYKKGTGLDLEYLFRAVNGKDSDYNSSLNGMTADLGWLNSFPVELHLGSGLRYLVRVTQINVDHKIFNERMVPIFSTVDFICKRLPDLPVNAKSDR
jgi:hypothetical protein